MKKTRTKVIAFPKNPGVYIGRIRIRRDTDGVLLVSDGGRQHYIYDEELLVQLFDIAFEAIQNGCILKTELIDPEDEPPEDPINRRRPRR